MKVKMLALSPAGELSEVVADPPDGLPILKAMCAAIGCSLVDCVSLADGLDMWVDDEGLLAEDPEVNPFATVIGHLVAGTEQQFAGIVVFAGERDGDTVSLAPEHRDLIGGLAGQLVQVRRAFYVERTES